MTGTTNRTTIIAQKKKMPENLASSRNFGGPSGTRTLDPLIKSQLL